MLASLRPLLLARRPTGLNTRSRTIALVPLVTLSRATHHPGDRGCAGVGNTMMPGDNSRNWPSNVRSSTGPRGSDANLRAGQLREVERMYRLAELEEHVIGHADDVAD
jgi:hypothetical protein